jgi:anhydro-N-acetylmuramic acid kinase
VVVGGGGAHNATLMNMIKKQLPTSVKLGRTSDFGIPDDAREAVAFALLGHESLMGNPSNLPSVTGARHPVILGNISM